MKKGKKKNLGSLAYFDAKTNKVEIDAAEIDKFIFTRKKKDLYIQQDLRHNPVPKGSTLMNQFRSNILSIEGSAEFVSLMNSQIDVMIEEMNEEFKGLKTEQAKKTFILSLITKGFIEVDTYEGTEEVLSEEYSVNDISDLEGENLDVAEKLLAGADINNVFIRNVVKKKILSYVEKNGLLMYGNRQTTEAIPDMFNQLQGYRTVRDKNGKERLLLPEIAANIPGARRPVQLRLASMDAVVKHLNQNKGNYLDMFDSEGNVNEWEIAVSKDEKGNMIYTIPGEIIISSRVPGDDMHSHTMGRYTLKTLGNTTALNQQISEASGEDYDGDQRYNQCFFRDKDKNIINDNSKKGLSNRAMLALREGYQNPANLSMLINPIDTNQYDSIVDAITAVAEKQQAGK
jgi:hypothetical protein